MTQPEPDPRFHARRVGAASIAWREDGLRLVNEAQDAEETPGRIHYVNAQIDDTQGRARGGLPWRPPLRLRLRARFSGKAEALAGTAGFGFWNDPFRMTGRALPTLPRAAWFFFASPPTDLPLAVGVPGRGWKAATLDVRPGAAARLALAAPLAPFLFRPGGGYEARWPGWQRRLGIAEARIGPPMTAWRDYALDWGAARCTFRVDGRLVLDAPAPRGPMGFVAWIDNQYLVATPWGRWRSGAVGSRGPQALEIQDIEIDGGAG